MKEKKINLREKPKAVLIGLSYPDRPSQEARNHIDELAFLTKTAGAIPVKIFIQKIKHPHPKYFIGSGKLEEVAEYVRQKKIDLIIFDDELTPGQLKNIERKLQERVLDRTNLILDIFAKRAKTAHAKVQVELAQYQYLLPRLTGMWTHLERQRGGIGLRGPGETEIETDRRIIRNKIASLKNKLIMIDKQMATQRKNRIKMVRVALVGYTNVGKSTIMNLLSKSGVFAENKLFATLDTTVRKIVFDNLPFLLSDTVGFIRKLPLHLVESFKSTLDELREADILIHIADISHPGFEEQIEVVRKTLLELGLADKSTFLVFNKIDSYVRKEKNDLTPNNKENLTLDELKNSWIAKEKNPSIFISAKENENILKFKEIIYSKVKEIHSKKYFYKFSDN